MCPHLLLCPSFLPLSFSLFSFFALLEVSPIHGEDTAPGFTLVLVLVGVVLAVVLAVVAVVLVAVGLQEDGRYVYSHRL